MGESLHGLIRQRETLPFFQPSIKKRENHNGRQRFLTIKVYMHIHFFSSLRDVIVTF